MSQNKHSKITSKTEFSRRNLLIAASTTTVALILPTTSLAQSPRSQFKRVPTQYIAALGDSNASSGNNAQDWGLWRKDPGPRGVDLEDYDKLLARNNIAPANWTFDNEDWWLEEHGLIMEAPEFPLPAGLYRVNGDREVEAILTVYPKASDGSQAWALDNQASIYDVTHLRCRSGRYTEGSDNADCSPAKAKQSDFPVRPGAEMPTVAGCDKLDYAVFIVTAIGIDNA